MSFMPEGRLWTRKSTFDPCSMCKKPDHGVRMCCGCGGAVSYCDKLCQLLHWRNGHEAECKNVHVYVDASSFLHKND